MDFQNQIIWITGASSGIGESLAYEFSKAGAQIIISSRKQDALKRVAAACAQPDKVAVEVLDVADFAAIPKVTQKIMEQFGRIDILVNNAGISQREFAVATDLSIDQKIMDVNYIGTVGVTKAVLPHMLQRKSGQIVTISSVMGKLGAPARSAYAASKHAIHGFFDSLRAEVHKDNIKVTILCPGYVNTNVTINALRGDGRPNNVKAKTTESGLDPHVFARKALRAIAKGKTEAYIGGKEIYAVIVKRLFPSLLTRILNRVKVSE